MGLNHRRGLSNVVGIIENELGVRETERGGAVGAPRQRAQRAQRVTSEGRGPNSTRFAAARAKAAAACATLG